MRSFLCLVSVLFLNTAAADPLPLTLGQQRNHTVVLPGLVRAAVADHHVVKVRAIPPSTLLFTALKPGTTSVRVWTHSGEQAGYLVTVLSPELYAPFESDPERDVVQVSLEFLELDAALSRAVGVRWPQAIQFSANGGLSGALSGITGLNYTTTFTSTRHWIQHLVEEGRAHVLSRPELYVRLGEEATFHSGGEFPVASATESYGKSQRHMEWKPFGLTVKVRPQSGDRLHIRSDIKVEISETNAALTVDGVPSITRRQLDTKMHSRDGETVILSGLVRQSGSLQKASVPFLASIPLIGPLLFSDSSEKREATEVFMAVTFSLSTRAREKETRERFQQRWQEETGGNP